MALTTPPAGGVDPNNPNPGTPPVPSFDPVAFEAKFNNILNGFAASLKKDLDKRFEAIKPPDADPNVPNPDTPPAPEPKNFADLNIKLAQMEKVIKSQGDALEAQTKETAVQKAAVLEEKRVNGFNAATSDIPWASPKAREQFKDAYLQKVKWAEDGSLIVETDKGPVSHDVFLKAEAENSPHFLAPQGHGGAGASPGSKPGSGTKINVLTMTPAQIQSLSPADRSAVMTDALSALGR